MKNAYGDGTIKSFFFLVILSRQMKFKKNYNNLFYYL